MMTSVVGLCRHQQRPSELLW